MRGRIRLRVTMGVVAHPEGACRRERRASEARRGGRAYAAYPARAGGRRVRAVTTAALAPGVLARAAWPRALPNKAATAEPFPIRSDTWRRPAVIKAMFIGHFVVKPARKLNCIFSCGCCRSSWWSRPRAQRSSRHRRRAALRPRRLSAFARAWPRPSNRARASGTLGGHCMRTSRRTRRWLAEAWSSWAAELGSAVWERPHPAPTSCLAICRSSSLSSDRTSSLAASRQTRCGMPREPHTATRAQLIPPRTTARRVSPHARVPQLPLTWGDASDAACVRRRAEARDGAVDLIVGSDLLYAPERRAEIPPRSGLSSPRGGPA